MKRHTEASKKRRQWSLHMGCMAALSIVCSAMGWNLDVDRVRYTMPYSHLDTRWRWDLDTYIKNDLPNTVNPNLALIKKYPGYIFNLEGAYRYQIMKDERPDLYAEVKKYVASGQWGIAGATYEAFSNYVPSPEAIIRQVLQGNAFWKREFGKTAVDFCQVDDFGFIGSLPTIGAHCGVKGMCTQKFGWTTPAYPLPFGIGIWKGPDGDSIVAVFRSSMDQLGQISGVYASYGFGPGPGDHGGAPSDQEVQDLMNRVAQNATSTTKTAVTTADRFFLDLTPAQMARFPKYSGDVWEHIHGIGTYTSCDFVKFWNKTLEQTADAAERASMAAEWLGTAAYPRTRLTDAWLLLLANQFHDVIGGTCSPLILPSTRSQYATAWGEFSGALNGALDAMEKSMDTRSQGTGVMVYNPLSIARTDAVDTTITISGGATALRVYDPSGAEVPSQLVSAVGDKVHLVFMATVPADGFAVYDVRKSTTAGPLSTGLSISQSGLENARYRVTIDANGDVSAILDKKNNRQLLSAPMRLAMLSNQNVEWDLWEINQNVNFSTPRAYASGTPQIRIVESGPARVALEVSRTTEGSTFVQMLRLCADSGDVVEVVNDITWKTGSTLLKATFPLSVSNPRTVYDEGIGVAARAIDNTNEYEHLGHEFADVTNASGDYGVSILSFAKYGWDKPSDNMQRLTLLHSPIGDNGELDYPHHIRYAVYGHTGTWDRGSTAWAARRFCQPLTGKQVAQNHDGAVGKEFSFIKSSSPQMLVMAVKKAENTDDIIVRVVEKEGRALNNGTLTFASTIQSAREVNGQEIDKATAQFSGSDLSISLRAYQPRAYAVRLTPPAGSLQLSRIQITPANAVVQPGQSQTFVATGVNQYGVAVAQQPSVTWSVTGIASAAITQAGVFTAGNDSGTCTVTATATGTPRVTGSIAVHVVRQLPQLCYKYYTGAFSSIASIPVNNPAQSGLIATFSFPPGSATTNFAVRYAGSINIPADGQYTFFMTVDDGAALRIDNAEILSATWDQNERSVTKNLTSGMHDIALDIYQGGGGLGISVSWQGPGILKQTIPATALYHLTCDNTPTITGVAQPQDPARFGFSAAVSKQEVAIRIAMPASRATPISVCIFDIRGRLVTAGTLAKADAGYHTVHFSKSHLSNGQYACRISAGEYQKSGVLLVGP